MSLGTFNIFQVSNVPTLSTTQNSRFVGSGKYCLRSQWKLNNLRKTRSPGRLRDGAYRRRGTIKSLQQAPVLGTTRGKSVHLPLDYFQLLGISSGDSSQINVVFRRLSEEPLDESYSTRASAGRQELLEEAKEEIAKESKAKSVAKEKRKVEIPWHLVPGALALLVQVSRFDLVIDVGSKVLASPDSSTMKRDILLAMAFAKLGQADDYFSQPNEVAMACTRMQEALEFLNQAGNPPLAPILTKEIEDALETYVPRCIQDQLKLPLTFDNMNGRKEAVNILKGLLAVSSRDSVLNQNAPIDRHYVKSVLESLSSTELLGILDWTTILNDPKCVKWYYPGLLLKGAAVYICIGFLQRRPALLKNLDNILSMPGKDREAHVEHVVCKVLLGEVEEALRILDRMEGSGKIGKSALNNSESVGDPSVAFSDELVSEAAGGVGVPTEHSVAAKFLPGRNETLAFIRASCKEGKEDLLPGLCFFVERWLSRAVFPQFKDLSIKPPIPSLNEFFQDRKVINYLSGSIGSNKNGNLGPFKGIGTFNIDTKKESSSIKAFPPIHMTKTIQENVQPKQVEEMEEKFQEIPQQKAQIPISHVEQRQEIRYPRPSKYSSIAIGLYCGAALGVALFSLLRLSASSAVLSSSTSTSSHNVADTEIRPRHYAYIQTAARPTDSLKEESFNRVNKGTVAIASGNTLKKAIAEKLIRKWQYAKSAALGPDHDFRYMNRILADPMLNSWTKNIEDVAEKGWFWKYKLERCKVTHIDDSNFFDGEGHINVYAVLKENVLMYKEKTKPVDKCKSFYKVAYNVILDEEGHWRISHVKIINS